VIEGQVASTTADGRESIEAPGHVIGVDELWGRRPAPATVRATTNVTLLVYGESEFRALLELPGVVEGLLGQSPTPKRAVPATASSRPSGRPALGSTLARSAAM
jgi:CRP-like cAMP-binding protein